MTTEKTRKLTASFLCEGSNLPRAQRDFLWV